jgi:transposase-like protein
MVLDPRGRRIGPSTGCQQRDQQVRGLPDLCADLDEEVGAFRDRSLAQIAYPYVFLDATYCKARVNRRVVSEAVVIATGVTPTDRLEVLGFDVGDSEDGAFWTAFLRSLKARGLAGVQLSSAMPTPA